MNTLDLREHVRQAISRNWDEFARAHPHLAGAIDQQALVESVRMSLDRDPHYQQVMSEAQAAGILGERGIELIRVLARKILALP